MNQVNDSQIVPKQSKKRRKALKKTIQNCWPLLVILAVISLMMACNDDNRVSTSFTPIDTSPIGSTSEPSPTSSASPSDPGTSSNDRVYTILNGAEVTRRQDCRKNPANWFADGFNIDVRIDKPEHEFHMVYNLFYSEEPGCEPVNTNPVPGASVSRNGNIFSADFEPPRACGRWQGDVALVDDTTDTVYPIFYGVFNTGSDTCAPPPPSCSGEECDPPKETCEDIEAKITSEYETGEESVCGVVEWSASNVTSCSVLEDGQEVSTNCNSGNEFCYSRQQGQSSDILWRLIVEKGSLKCDPTTTIPVPPLRQPTCEDIDIVLKAEESGDDNSNDKDSITYEVTSNVLGSFNGGPAGQTSADFTLECDDDDDLNVIFVADYEQLGCQDSILLEAPDCSDDPCEDSFLELDAKIDGSTLYIYTNSSTAGVAHALGVDIPFGPGEQTNSIPIPQDACGRDIEVTASNRCEDEASTTVETDECPECDTKVSVTTRDDGQTEIAWDVQSNVPGGTVTIYVYRDGELVSTLENRDRQGRIVRPLDCNSAGKYRVVVVYENEEYDLHCEDEVEFEIDSCPPQECVLPEQGKECFDGPLGNPEAECGQWGLIPLSKDDDLSGTTHIASRDAALAIVKNGSPFCYNLYPNVEAGDVLATPNDGKDISHVTYCACPRPDFLATLLGLPSSCGTYNSTAAEPKLFSTGDD